MKPKYHARNSGPHQRHFAKAAAREEVKAQIVPQFLQREKQSLVNENAMLPKLRKSELMGDNMHSFVPP